MNFDTPAAYASHLAELIHDPALIRAAVRQKFPPRPAAVTERSRQSTTKPATASDPWMHCDHQDAESKSDMAKGSRTLFDALWREHPRILNKLSENENCLVMRP